MVQNIYIISSRYLTNEYRTWHYALLLVSAERQISPTGTKIENWSARDPQKDNKYMTIATLPGYDGLGEGSGRLSGFSVSRLCHAGVGTSTGNGASTPACICVCSFMVASQFLATQASPSAGLILTASASL